MAKIVLSNGKNVEISNVILNKEQNINVSKTYVTTVKKAVTKVSDDFYKVESVSTESTSSPIFEAVKEDVFVAPTPAEEVVVPTVKEPKAPEMSTEVVSMPEVNPVVEAASVEPILPTADVVAPVPEAGLTPDSVSLPEAPKVEPVLPVSGEVTPAPVEEVKPVEVAPVVEAPKVEPILPVPGVVPSAGVEEKPPVAETPNLVSESNMLFDGSKETNLNKALGEISEDKMMTTQSDGVQALRQFGSDEPVVAPQETVVGTTPSSGFANNKFFTVVAIFLFVAACVFLGYEAFQYFQIK